MRHCLALDQAKTRTGYAIGSTEMEKPITGVYLPPKVGARHGVMLGELRDWLDVEIKTYHIGKVIFEAPFAGKDMNGFAIVNKMLGVIELVCDDHEIPCVRAAPVEWRSRFLGNAHAPKEISQGLSKPAARSARRQWLKAAAIAACNARGWPVDTDDEAEAAGLLDFLLACDSETYRERYSGGRHA